MTTEPEQFQEPRQAEFLAFPRLLPSDGGKVTVFVDFSVPHKHKIKSHFG